MGSLGKRNAARACSSSSSPSSPFTQLCWCWRVMQLQLQQQQGGPLQIVAPICLVAALWSFENFFISEPCTNMSKQLQLQLLVFLFQLLLCYWARINKQQAGAAAYRQWAWLRLEAWLLRDSKESSAAFFAARSSSREFSNVEAFYALHTFRGTTIQHMKEMLQDNSYAIGMGLVVDRGVGGERGDIVRCVRKLDSCIAAA